jgi:tetratricopeptide (TPR) repeat protein
LGKKSFGTRPVGRSQPGILKDGVALLRKGLVAEICNNLRVVLLYNGQVDEAIVHYQKALELDPNNVDAHKYLAWILATCPDTSVRNGTQAFELDFWSGSPRQTQTVTWNYSSILPAIEADGNTSSSGYIELILTSNSGGGAPHIFDFNNAVLSGGPVPEPSTLALIGLGAAGLLVVRRRRNHRAPSA